MPIFFEGLARQEVLEKFHFRSSKVRPNIQVEPSPWSQPSQYQSLAVCIAKSLRIQILPVQLRVFVCILTENVSGSLLIQIARAKARRQAALLEPPGFLQVAFQLAKAGVLAKPPIVDNDPAQRHRRITVNQGSPGQPDEVVGPQLEPRIREIAA